MDGWNSIREFEVEEAPETNHKRSGGGQSSRFLSLSKHLELLLAFDVIKQSSSQALPLLENCEVLGRSR